MITITADLPESVLGAEASGMVSGADYEQVLVPAVEAYLQHHQRVRVLLVLGPAFEGFEGGAMWDDAKLGMSKIGAWERIAVVTDHAHLRGLINTMAFAMPGAVRTFAYADLPEARAWVAA